ncbi:PREDICTED: uncharacterized protein LOC106818239 [Priapulus caudatus]|uniref:Uncharacterized protein LOC106818239 n=1 Tax=Priapulus caudatus TaxID=37621 RepID=A0ABM1F1X6_PRICU|nr:PREDICTED: uncharacterized protein LOC106818239 [Priapulus caudatus]
MGPTKKQSPEKRRALHRQLMQQTRTTAVSTVQGSFHQGSPLLPSQNRGTQCTCMSLIALMTAQNTSLARWTTAHLDSILLEGDQLYSSCRRQRHFMMINELPQSVSHHGVQYELTYHNAYCGTLGRNSTEAPFYTLADAIIAAQRVSQHNFLLVGSDAHSYTCMLMNLGPPQGCFVFDSHSRDVYGMGTADGTSVLVTLPSVDQVPNHIYQLSISLQLTSTDKFEVVPCSVHITQQQVQLCTPPLDQYLQQQAAKHTQKRQLYQNKWLSKPGVKEQRQLREKVNRGEPEVKRIRREREATQRQQAEVKQARQTREAAQRQQDEVKQARQTREAAQRQQDEVKQARQTREAAQRQQAEVKQARQTREAAQRQQAEVKQAQVKQARQTREKAQRQKTQVKETQNQKRVEKQLAESEKLKDINEVLHRFQKKISQLPDYTCCFCETFRFRHQVQKYTSQKYRDHAQIVQVCQLSDEKEDQWICLACHKSLTKGKLPPLSTKGNNLKSISMPVDLKDLNTLEQFLLTPVIPFMKIICLPKGTQRGMHGPVVCVAANVPDTVSKLPRSIDDSGLLKVKLKRKLQYRGHHLYQQVRTNLVADAFHFLQQQHPSFADIPRNHTLDISCQHDSAALITESNLPPTQSEGGIESTDVTSPHTTPSTSQENQGDAVDEDEVSDTSAPLVTCLQPTDLSQYISDTQEDNIFCVAPAEQNRPQSIQDKECQAFPLLFPEGKQTYADTRPVKLTLSQYIKSRFFSADNKYAMNPEYLFYLQYLKEFNEVLSSACISLRKASGYQSHVTVGQLTSAASFRQMVHQNEGYKFLTKVRGSAPYWDKTLRDLCAMVKQLGIPTWFASFSAADRRWPEIASAFLKKESEEGALLKAAQKDAREGNEDAVKELRTIGQVYVTHREVSVMEAIWRGTGMKLKACSREIIWVPADEQSTRMTLPLSVLRNIAKQKGQDTTDVFQKSILDRYWARPSQALFTNMCLADFVAQYRLVTGSRDVDHHSDTEHDTHSSTVILLQDNMGAVAKRKTPAVIRYLKVSKAKDSERHFCTLLRMYMPHRGKQMKGDDETYEEVFMSHHIKFNGAVTKICHLVVQNMDRYEHCTEEIDDAWSAVQQGDRLEDGWAEIAPGAEEERSDTQPQHDDQFSHEEEVPELPDLEAALPST